MSIFKSHGGRVSAISSNELVAKAINKIKLDGEKGGVMNYSQLVYESLKYMSIEVVDYVPTALVHRNANKMQWEILISSEVNTLPEMVFVLLHEASHVIFGHFDLTEEEQRRYPNHSVCNICMDAQLNSYIIDDNTSRYVAPIRHPEPEKGFSGRDVITEHIHWQDMYDEVEKKQKEIAENTEIVVIDARGGAGGFGGGGGGDSDSDEQQDQGQNGGKGKGKSKGKKGKGNIITVLLTDDRDGSGSLNGNASTGNPELDKMIDEKIKDELGKMAQDMKDGKLGDKSDGGDGGNNRSGSGGKKAGSGYSKVNIILDELINRAKVHEKLWAKILKKYLTGMRTKSNSRIHTFKRPNRRFGESARGTIVPIDQGKLGVLVDCSGSMCDTVMRAIADTATISGVNGGIDKLLFWNTALQAEYRNIKKSNLEKIKCRGSGGTMLSKGIKALASDNISLLVLLTDLELWDSNDDGSNDFVTIEETSKIVPIVIGTYDGGHHDFKSSRVHVIDLDQDQKE